jgi:hypothetical protein
MTNTNLITASKEGDIKTVKALLERGADVNEQDKEGWTALMYAAARGDSALVKLLLASEAKIDEWNQDGATALGLAAQEGHKEVARLLRKAGADCGMGWCCPICYTSLYNIDDCPHYVGGGDRGNDDEFNTEISDATYELNELLEEMDDKSFEDLLRKTPDALIFTIEYAREEGRYYWLYDGELAVTRDETEGFGISGTNENCYHQDPRAFVERVKREAEAAIEWIKQQVAPLVEDEEKR